MPSCTTPRRITPQRAASSFMPLHRRMSHNNSQVAAEQTVADPVQITVGELAVRFLEQCGTRAAFGVISIDNMPILDAPGHSLPPTPVAPVAASLRSQGVFVGDVGQRGNKLISRLNRPDNGQGHAAARASCWACRTAVRASRMTSVCATVAPTANSASARAFSSMLSSTASKPSRSTKRSMAAGLRPDACASRLILVCATFGS